MINIGYKTVIRNHTSKYHMVKSHKIETDYKPVATVEIFHSEWSAATSNSFETCSTILDWNSIWYFKTG